MADPGERELLERAKRDPEAFGRLYDFYVTPVYRYVYGRVGDRLHAEDVTADVFRRALESIGRFQWDEKPFSAWLFGIARRAVADHFRRAGREVAGGPLSANFPEKDNGEPFRDLDLWRAVDDLPEEQRQVVILRFCGDLSFRQIGPVLGKSEDTAKMMLYRALKTLQRAVRGDDGTGEGGTVGPMPEASGALFRWGVGRAHRGGEPTVGAGKAGSGFCRFPARRTASKCPVFGCRRIQRSLERCRRERRKAAAPSMAPPMDGCRHRLVAGRIGIFFQPVPDVDAREVVAKMKQTARSMRVDRYRATMVHWGGGRTAPAIGPYPSVGMRIRAVSGRRSPIPFPARFGGPS